MRSRLWRFKRDEDGSLIIFGLFAFVMMLLLAGVSLDLMRFEERRTVLQNTIDRASLAAADLNQTLDAKSVVRDYFLKAGLTPPEPDNIIVTQSATGDSRSVQISVSENMDTWFMSLVGVKELSTPAASTATESIGQIEISLILDVSGSMNGSRPNNLKPAAKDFVDRIFDSGEEDKVSISIIPYATQVAISDDLASYFNITNEQTYSACIEFEDAAGDFDTTAMSVDKTAGSRVYQRNGHFDPFYKASPPRLMNCPPEAERRVMPFSGDRDALKTYIDGLFAEGNTSIDIGMKWGAALLDPSLKPVVTGMIADGDRPAEFAQRPYSYTNKDAIKIIVLMTDGENTTEYRLRNNTDSNPYFEEGISPLVRNPIYRTNGTSSDDYDIDQYSLWDDSRHQYFVYAIDDWRNQPWGSGSTDVTTCTGWGWRRTCTTVNQPDPGSAPIPMEWQDVWHDMSLYWFSDYIIYNAYDSSSLRNAWRPNAWNSVPSTYIYSDKDTRTLEICSAAKDENIRIYSIAFEAPRGGQQLLESCQNAGYYAVEGLDINEAFEGIANSINKLRLTH